MRPAACWKPAFFCFAMTPPDDGPDYLSVRETAPGATRPDGAAHAGQALLGGAPFRRPVPGDPLLALLPKARRRWAQTDPVLAAIAREHPPPERPLAFSDPFEALVSSIAHQQVSMASGRAIVGRITAACGGAIAPEAVLRLGEPGVRAAGFSRPKTGYVLDLARKVADGHVDFARLAQAPDEEAIATLTEVKGIGTWTAKMFLLFQLSRPDVHPHEDLGLQVAVSKAYRVPRTRAAAKMVRLHPAWSPYASVAALTLWNWRRVVG